MFSGMGAVEAGAGCVPREGVGFVVYNMNTRMRDEAKRTDIVFIQVLGVDVWKNFPEVAVYYRPGES
jgi:hypothetical protein